MPLKSLRQAPVQVLHAKKRFRPSSHSSSKFMALSSTQISICAFLPYIIHGHEAKEEEAYLVKSFKSLPCFFWTSLQISSALWRSSAMDSKSFSTRPREVMAGAPIRTPPGAIALTSPTTAFLFSVMWHKSHAFSILLPVMPCIRSLILSISCPSYLSKRNMYINLSDLSVNSSGLCEWSPVELSTLAVQWMLTYTSNQSDLKHIQGGYASPLVWGPTWQDGSLFHLSRACNHASSASLPEHMHWPWPATDGHIMNACWESKSYLRVWSSEDLLR